jgi:hypothetical protein
MIRPPLLLALLLTGLIPAGPAAAQHLVPFVAGGVAVGGGDLSKDSNNGWSVVGGVDVDMPAILSGLALGFTGSHARIGFSGGFGEEMAVTTFAAELAYLTGPILTGIRPYVRAGGGLQIHRYDPGIIDTSPVTDTRPALVAGVGVRIAIGPADAMLGGRISTGSDAGVGTLHGGLAVPIRISY